MGGSVGLFDNLAWPASTASYSYEDIGYSTTVVCSYNFNNQLQFEWLGEAGGIKVFAVLGWLPNSQRGYSGREYMTYVGMDDHRRVIALSSAMNPIDERRIIAITAGNTYKQLDAVQCEAKFVPTTFNVSVTSTDRTIKVTPIANRVPVRDFADGGSMTTTVMRELSAIPKNLQGWDFSLVGESFNTSITNYRTSHQQYLKSLGISGSTNDTYSVLRGLEGAFTAMIDDVLTAYGAAQFMVAGDTRHVPASLDVLAIQFGQASYVSAIFTLNTVILLLVGAQAVRTRLWYDLPAFDCLDPSSMLLASSRGGKAISTAVDALDRHHVTVSLDRNASDRLVLHATGHL